MKLKLLTATLIALFFLGCGEEKLYPLETSHPTMKQEQYDQYLTAIKDKYAKDYELYDIKTLYEYKKAPKELIEQYEQLKTKMEQKNKDYVAVFAVYKDKANQVRKNEVFFAVIEELLGKKPQALTLNYSASEK